MTARRLRRKRRGTLLLETAISALMLMIAMGMVATVVESVASQRRAWDRRAIAAAEVANVLERLASRPYRTLVPGPVEGLILSTSAAEVLPAAEVSADVVDDSAGDAPSRRVTVQLRWRNRAGDWEAPIRLVTWVHDRKEAS